MHDAPPDWVCHRTLNWVANRLERERTELQVDLVQSQARREVDGIASIAATRDVVGEKATIEYVTHLITRIRNRAARIAKTRSLK